MSLSPVTRRAFVRGMTAVGLAAVGSGGAAAMDDVADIAVIGGGVAGCYAAWRLKVEAPSARVEVFEMSDRIGGRLHSFRFSEAPHAVAEVGGMRFLSDHRIVQALVGHLGLAKKPFINSGAANFLNLRGRSIRFDKVGQKDAVFPFAVPVQVQKGGWEPLLHRAAEAIVPGAVGLTEEGWTAVRESAQFQGRLVRNWSLWPAIEQVLSFEEADFLRAASGYDQMIEGPNCADMLQLMLAHDTPGQPVETD